MAKEFRPDPKPEPKKKGAVLSKGTEVNLCACGCGESAKSLYIRGHQSKKQQKKKPDEAAFHFIQSSLLGDGYLSFQTSGAGLFGETHSVKHKEYVDYIVACLGETTTGHLVKLVSGHGSDTLRVTSRTYLSLGELKKVWYPKGKKELPKDLSWLDDFSIAKWYMDDGSLQGTTNKTRYPIWATNSFSITEAETLGRILTEKYGFDVAIDIVREDQPIIRAKVGYQENKLSSFWEKISPHVHPSMRYKLPVEYQNVPFIPYVRGKEIDGPPTPIGGKSPRAAGKRVERNIAKELGESPTIGSGAFKQAGLTGDITVRDNEGRDYVKLEVKMTSQLNANKEKVYSFKEKELIQMINEAREAHQLGALVFHYKNGQTFVVMPFADWQIMLNDAKLGVSKSK